jgi:cyanate permease
VSLAFNGATLGGVIVAPALIPLIGRLGFGRAVAAAAVAMLLVLLPIAAGVMRRGPEAVGLGPDGDASFRAPSRGATASDQRPRAEAVRTWRFWSVSIPFALGLAAQVGVLTHQVALLTPALGAGGSARAVSDTTLAAVIGRLVTGVVVDRLNPRRVASATLAAQIAGVALLAGGSSTAALYTGCVLFGIGVGNLTTLPGLIVAAEWPRERFAALVALVVAINQFTFAFGPSLVGVLRDWSGSYGPALGLCIILQALAATLVLLGPPRQRL